MSDVVACMLCGASAPPLEMAAAGAPALGHHLDFALAVKWFCPDPCFNTYRHDPHLKERVYQFQDNAAKWARMSVANVSDEALREMETLPEGLRVSAAERALLDDVRDRLHDVTELQDFEINHLLHKVCRNLNRNDFFHPTEHKLVSYGELQDNLRKIERAKG